ncbi:MAG: aminotransferase class V-fold PLP-dependent enzyme [Turicibacter sp.]|nr:aminotransferase class V-fold PLP-dependent enzyme [Turicibacter sp.]
MPYLDHASATFTKLEVLDEFCRVEREFIANVQANHVFGERARAEFEKNKAKIADLAECKAENVIFTSSATESNVLAIKSAIKRRRKGHIITSFLEHPSITAALAELQEAGCEIDFVEIDKAGKIDLEHLEELLHENTALITVPLVDSELGAVQHIVQIADILKKYPNCHFHVDAAQAVGKVPVNFIGMDTLSASPHKFNGICGIGILFSRYEIEHRGTQPLALAASAAVAWQLAEGARVENVQIAQNLNEDLRKFLAKYPKVKINSPLDSTHILNISVLGIKSADFVKSLNELGVCVSIKSTCDTTNTPSRPVFAITADKKRALSSWRISFSHATKIDEIEEFMELFDICYKKWIG